jgi:hypothetical protein
LSHNVLPFTITDTPENADIFIDDIVDSGRTKEKYLAKFPNAKFYALIENENGKPDNPWIVFPWEENSESSIDDAFVRLEQYYGIDKKIIKNNIEEVVANCQH